MKTIESDPKATVNDTAKKSTTPGAPLRKKRPRTPSDFEFNDATDIDSNIPSKSGVDREGRQRLKAAIDASRGRTQVSRGASTGKRVKADSDARAPRKKAGTWASKRLKADTDAPAPPKEVGIRVSVRLRRQPELVVNEVKSLPLKQKPTTISIGRPRLALRTKDTKTVEVGTPPEQINQFLDPDAEYLSSDGDSGDEIPARLPGPVADCLRRYADAVEAVQKVSGMVTELRADKKKAVLAIKKPE